MDYTRPIINTQSLNRGIRGKKGLIGIEAVNSNLHRLLEEIKDKSLMGMAEAAIIIRRDMEDTPPTIPVDLGNLRASWFTTSRMGGGQTKAFKGKNAGELAAEKTEAINICKAAVKAQKEPSLIMGFSANYAAPVHEMVGVTFNKKGKAPGSGAKFFQSALARNTKLILRVIKDTVNITP